MGRPNIRADMRHMGYYWTGILSNLLQKLGSAVRCVFPSGFVFASPTTQSDWLHAKLMLANQY